MAARAKLFNKTVQKMICRWYRNGVSLRTICANVKASLAPVLRVLRTHKVKFRHRGRPTVSERAKAASMRKRLRLPTPVYVRKAKAAKTRRRAAKARRRTGRIIRTRQKPLRPHALKVVERDETTALIRKKPAAKTVTSRAGDRLRISIPASRSKRGKASVKNAAALVAAKYEPVEPEVLRLPMDSMGQRL